MFGYETIKKVMLIHAMGVILHVSCHDGCVHDALEATKGVSPQFYDFKKTIERNKLVKADSQSSARKSAGLKLPKTVHRTKRSIGDHSNDSDRNFPVESSSVSQNGFAKDPQNISKVIGGKQKQVKSEASDEQRVSQKTSNNEQYHKELFKPIRIKIFMQDEYISFKLTSKFFKRLNESVHRAVKKIQNILSVIPVKGRLRFNRTPESICSNFWSEHRASARLRPRRCAIADSSYSGETCMDNFKLPDAHLRGYPIYRNNTTTPTQWLYQDGTGIPDADIVLYVLAKNTVLCKQNGLIAYATYCQVDQHHRPVAGLINYCPNYLKDPLYNEDVTYLTSLHEIFHVLGFSKDLFDKFQSCEIKIDKSKISNRTLIKWICERRKNSIGLIDGLKNIVTPAVRRETKRQFGCKTVEGCPLENHIVRPVTTSSHWEGKFMQGSLMAPTISLPHLTVLDRITLSAFEDMGWYRVNYNESEELAWGKQAGCEFFRKEACSNDSSQYFCHAKSSIGCHYLHLDKGVCRTDKYLDECHVFKSTAGMECWKPENGKENSGFNGEIYTADSCCFESNLHRINLTDNVPGVSSAQGRCYEHRCSENKTLEVRVEGSKWKTCIDDKYLEFEGYEGGVVCPAASILCRNKTKKISDTVTPTPTPTQGMIICGNFTVMIPGLSNKLQLLSSNTGSEDNNEEFIGNFSEMIKEPTNVCKNCVTNIQHRAEDMVSFVLKMKLIPTNLSARASAESDSAGSNHSNTDSNRVAVENSCVTAVKNMLEFSKNGKLLMALDGTEYITDKIDFVTPLEEVRKLKESYEVAFESDNSGAGLYAAAAVGSVCGTALILIGVIVYWKNAINVAVSPIPATPIRADVRYHMNRGSVTIAPSENGSAGQLPNIDIP